MALSHLRCTSGGVHCDGNGEFTKIEISNGLTTGSLADLAPHTKVSSLVLISTVHVSGDLRDLTPLTELIFLDLYGLTRVTGELSVLGAAFPSLQQIGLQETSVRGSLAGLAPLTALTDLDLEGVAGISGDLSDLSGLTLIDDLDLGRTAVTGNLSALQAWPRLTFVYLAECTGIYGDLASLAPLHNLEALFLRGCASVSGDVASLPRNNYTKLSLSGTSAFCNSPPCKLRSPEPQPSMTGQRCAQVEAHCRTEEMVTCYIEECTGLPPVEPSGSLGAVGLTVIVIALAAAACALASWP